MNKRIKAPAQKIVAGQENSSDIFRFDQSEQIVAPFQEDNQKNIYSAKIKTVNTLRRVQEEDDILPNRQRQSILRINNNNEQEFIKLHSMVDTLEFEHQTTGRARQIRCDQNLNEKDIIKLNSMANTENENYRIRYTKVLDHYNEQKQLIEEYRADIKDILNEIDKNQFINHSIATSPQSDKDYSFNLIKDNSTIQLWKILLVSIFFLLLGAFVRGN